MKTSVLLSFILIFSITCVDPLTLYTVSSSPTTVIRPSGSVKGGTTIYIKGLGFDTVAANNQVLVGPYPCIIPADGATQTSLACVTSDTNQLSSIPNLPITVISNGQQQQLTNEQGVFSYNWAQTPIIYRLFPGSAVAGSLVKFYGLHRISNLGDGLRDMGDVISMMIGNSQCGRFDIAQGPISPNNLDFISCKLSPIQQADRYTVQQYLKIGYSAPQYRLPYSNFLKNNFHFTLLPAISSVSPSSGAQAGQLLTITGSGFSTDKSVVSVSVDGNDCSVQQSSISEIKCKLGLRNNSISSKLKSNSANQANPYFSGAGLYYRRYDITSLSPQNINGLRNAVQTNSSQITLQQQGFRGQINTGNYFGVNYGQVFTGYFLAPTTGTYTFYGVGDDAFALYLSSITGSTESAATPLISAAYWSSDIFYLGNPQSATAKVTLQAGQSYYLQAYHINYGGAGSFRIFAQIPNSDLTLEWQTHAVHRLQLNFTNDPQIVTFTQSGGTAGSINLTITTRAIGKPATVQSAVISYNASQSQFLNALKALSPFGAYNSAGYQITVVRSTLDVNGNITSNASEIYSYVWTVTVPLARSLTDTKAAIVPVFINYSGTQNFKQVITYPHGPLISGTFGLSINGITLSSAGTTSLRFNLGASDLQAAFQAIPGFERTQVYLVSSSSMQSYGSVWLIYFMGINSVLPPIVTSSFNLMGGYSSTKPNLYSSVLRDYSSDLLLDPLDYTVLRQASNKINVLVSVRGIPNVCIGTCGYTFLSNTPTVTSATRIGTTPQVRLSLTDPALLNYSLNDITITIGGQTCTITNTSSLINNFTCILPVNPNGSPSILADNYLPVVKLNNFGSVPLDNSITPLVYPLTLTSIDKPSGSQTGGQNLLLTGIGFPTSLTQAVIKICNKSATILSINNTHANIIVPQCAIGSTPVTISNSKLTSNSLSFSYTTAAPPGYIYSVSPISHNPSLKGIMVITGVGFGTNTNGVRVDLANSSGKVYSMRILSLNDTYIKCGIPGGLAGIFQVQVNLIGVGQILPNQTGINKFTYQLIITSITPTSGSAYGGTLINIQGINFADAFDETLVNIGDQLNQLCVLESVNKTNILCRTPTKSIYYNTSTPYEVILTNRLMVDNTCPSNSCSFSFINQNQSPFLNYSSSYYLSSGDINLYGVRFGTNSSVVFTNINTGLVTIVSPKSNNDSTITVSIPSVQSGSYQVRVRVDPLGHSNPLFINISVYCTSTPVSLSLNGGRIYISGSGLPNGWPNTNFIINVPTGQSYNVISSIPSLMIVQVPATPTTLKIKISSSVVATSTTLTANPLAIATPQIQLTSPSTITYSSAPTQLIFTPTNLKTTLPTYLVISSTLNPAQIYNITSLTLNNSLISASTVLPGGKYTFSFLYNSYGFSNCTSTLSVTISKPTISSSSLSFNGGSIPVTGFGLSPSAKLTINGFTGSLSLNSNSTSQASALIPPFVTSLTQSSYNLVQPTKLTRNYFTPISDQNGADNVFDPYQGTIYTSTNPTCYIGIDVGSDLTFLLTRFRYFPNSKWSVSTSYLSGAIFQASNDGNNYTTLATLGNQVHSGWNIIQINNIPTYRFFRLSHNTQSACQFSSLQFTGILYSATNVVSLSSNPSTLTYNDGYNLFTYSSLIDFKQTATPVVSTLSKTTGDVFGGYDITLNGQNLNFDTPSVYIDGLVCPIKSSNVTSITCTVPARLQLPSSNSFVVKIGNSNAILLSSFRYVMRWSDIRTWGTDMPPVDGDLVWVPPGMHLLVDQSTPKLASILVQNGTLQFSDQIDMKIRAGSITVVGGRFIAGTQANPYKKILQFQMYGDYYGKQLPMFGNKGIGCHECLMSLYGTPRPITWTSLKTSALPNTNSIIVEGNVDWKVGQQIVIASTDFNHNHAERRTISSVNLNSNNSTTLTFSNNLLYLHQSVVSQYGSDQLTIKAEVALITRNIKMHGSSQSQITNYGSHLMMAGSAENGLVGHIAYTQFYDCGQPRILGRYCIHFHMNGDVSSSYAIGNAVHNSMARVITLHGVHYLRVQNNVGYDVQGHNYFIQDGIQTNNLLKNNLAISSKQSWTMLQTDISVASFWITNPSNNFIGNHAAGSDFYGFWYQIKPRPDGPSASPDICPMGNSLGVSRSNVAHSNVRFGLRIFKLAPRQIPCLAVASDNQTDPWALNPGIIGTFSDYTLYRNGECGLLAQQTGNLIFDNIVTADNKRAGAQFYVTQFTKAPVSFKNSVLIGVSSSGSISLVPSSKGVITPRQGNIQLTNLRFYNYGNGMHSLQTCSNCDHSLLFSNTAQEIYASKISYTNVTSKLFMNGHKKQIIYDLDGSLTNSGFDNKQRKSAAIVNKWPHLTSHPACSPTTSVTLWDNTLACDQSVKVVRVTFRNLKSSIFDSVGLKTQSLASLSDLVPQNSTSFTQIFSYFATWDKMDSKTLPKTYALPYIAGQTYAIWWLTGLDFDQLTMSSSPYFKDTDPGVIFKFNYTLNRQMYDIGRNRPSQAISATNLFYPNTQFLDSATCADGQYYHDNTAGNRTLQLCASGKNKTYYQTVVATAIYCRYLCPAPPGTFVKETFVRYWSNISQWPQGRLPRQGQNVTINGNWTIIMDIDPASCEVLTIDGDVIIEDKQNRNITCKSIWIRAGSLTAGSASAPFTHNINIKFTGLKSDPGYVFDQSLVGGKMFVITGKLELYGSGPSTTFTKLTSTAKIGDTTINVATNNGWNIGDQIVLSPSFSSSKQYQRVKITAINGLSIDISPALKYNHYGASDLTINNGYGTLDARTSVGHVTRNIKFISGDDQGWGYSVIVYQMWQGNYSRVGQAKLINIQFTSGGQYDTLASTLVLNNNQASSAGQTIVSGCSFSFCRSSCLRASFHTNTLINNNVFYQGRKYHIQLSEVTLFNVTSNLMIGAIVRPTMVGSEPVACLQATDVSSIDDKLLIKDNICQGSDVNGFVLPFYACGSQPPYISNTAGSCRRMGFLLTRTTSDKCLAFSGPRAYGCAVGVVSNPPNTQRLQLSNYIIADCGRGLSLRWGLQGNDRTAVLTNSYITAISRPSCNQCYGSGVLDCSSNEAIRLPAVTINGQHYPMAFDSYDGLCKNQVLDAKAYIYNSSFNLYRKQYSSIGLSQCTNNVIFKDNPGAMDNIGSAYLWNTNCDNCQISALAQFYPPNPAHLGWFGGCGKILCTGRNNYIIQDLTESIFKGTALANNSWIGNALPNCQFYPQMNGHICSRYDLGILQYQNIAPDYNTRIMWPVTLQPYGGSWKSQTNGYREWDWSGNEPLNKRLGRFISTIQLFQMYNMSFASNPPDDMNLQLQKRTQGGNNSDWVMVQVYYPFPNMIEVQVGGNVIKPIPITTASSTPIDISICGSNKFFYQNYTILFAITGNPNCQVRISLTNAIQLTLRFAMDINLFYSSVGTTRLVDRVCAVLGINDQSRVKIVGVYTGSTVLEIMINDPPAPQNQSTLKTQDNTTSLRSLQGTVNQLYLDGTLDKQFKAIGMGQLLQASSIFIPKSPSSEEDGITKQQLILIIVFSVIGALMILTGLVIYCLKRSTANKVIDNVIPQFSEQIDRSKNKKSEDIRVQQNTQENISQIKF